MEYLNFMASSNQIEYALLALGSIFLSLCSLLLVVRSLRIFHYLFHRSAYLHQKSVIRECLEFKNVEYLSKIKRPNVYLRVHLLKLAEKIEGETLNLLTEVYSNLGYVDKDINDLESIFYFKRASALSRLRVFEYPIPNNLWPKLFMDSKLEFRWAAMEYYIISKRKACLPNLMAFVSNPKNVNRGYAHHLLAKYASIDGMAIPFLLEHCDNEHLKEALLRVLSIYPVPGSDYVIRKSFNYMSSLQVINTGLIALEAHPDPHNKYFLEQFQIHENWEVRLNLAKNLRHYTDEMKLIEELSLDGSYEVRSQISKVLIELLPYSGKVVANILKDSSHPCYDFISHQGITLPEKVAS